LQSAELMSSVGQISESIEKDVKIFLAVTPPCLTRGSQTSTWNVPLRFKVFCHQVATKPHLL